MNRNIEPVTSVGIGTVAGSVEYLALRVNAIASIDQALKIKVNEGKYDIDIAYRVVKVSPTLRIKAVELALNKRLCHRT